MKGVEEKLVTKSVLPLLIKLARDSEMSVLTALLCVFPLLTPHLLQCCVCGHCGKLWNHHGDSHFQRGEGVCV